MVRDPIGYHDHNSVDLNEEAVFSEPTFDTAKSYCQRCLDKSIEWFRVNETESITLCVNPGCSDQNHIAYDANNNGDLKDRSKRFKYSKEIMDMSAPELKTFFDKEIDTVSCYKKLQTVIDTLIRPRSISQIPRAGAKETLGAEFPVESKQSG